METKLIKCSRCNYEWETKSKLLNICCPNCNYKTKNIEFRKLEKKTK